ncbi:MAG: hypothetical protein ACYC1M_10075 [Armatimonadota bacterium]
MKRNRETNSSRVKGWLAALCGLVVGMVAVSAQAQTEQTQLAVTEFTARTSSQQTLLARAATDAVALELSRNGFVVMSRSQVQAAISDLSLDTPLDKVGVSQLGQKLGATSIVQGTVMNLRLEGTPRRASVNIIVRMTDPLSGEDVNGAVVSGRSNQRVGFNGDDQQLIREAISNAAYEAAKTMASYNIPTATVLNTIGGDEVLLNNGARGGLAVGMEMLVQNHGQNIGRLSVVRVSDTDAVAKVITSTRGIKPEDRVRAIFAIPEITTVKGNTVLKPAKVAKPSVWSSVGKILLIGAVIYGVSMIGGGGNNGVDNVAALATIGPSGAPAIVVNWEPSKFAQGNADRLQFYIIRDDVLYEGNTTDKTGWIATGDPNAKNYIDTTVVAGASHSYRVVLEYNYVNPSSAEVTVKLSDPVWTNRVTAIGIPSGLSPFNGSDTEDLTKMKFIINTSLGADQYQVQVSTDPLFPASGSYSVTMPAGKTTTDEINLLSSGVVGNTMAAKFLAAQTQRLPIYWRVGARRLGDPDPSPNGWIYGDRFQFVSSDTPPPPPTN